MNINKKITFLLIAILLLGFLTACNHRSHKNVVELLQADERFSILVQAVVKANLASALAETDSLTVFAPTNNAFKKFLTANNLSAEQLLNAPNLADILKYHVLATEVSSMDAIAVANSSNNIISMLNDKPLALSDANGALNANLSEIIEVDNFGSNGVIHVVNEVIVPPADSALSNVEKTIADIVVDLAGSGDNAEFTQLLNALSASSVDLAATLANPNKKYTVFAPTDAAFTAIADVAAGLSTEQLTAILLQHVVDVEIDAVQAYAANGMSVKTLSGVKLPVAIDSNKLSVAGAQVVIADVKAANGVIHVIDQVIVK